MKQLNRDEIEALNLGNIEDEYDFSGKTYKLLKDPETDVYIYVYIIRATLQDGETRSSQRECFRLEIAEAGDWKRLVEAAPERGSRNQASP